MKKYIIAVVTVAVVAFAVVAFLYYRNIRRQNEGVLPGVFSVGVDRQVIFSKGNLQYQASTNKWRFAARQYDVMGGMNNQISDSTFTYIDLFGFGSTGYNGQAPYLYDGNTALYGDTTDLTGTNYDWGQYCAVENGGREAGLWRTLSIEEWQYLFEQRDNAIMKYNMATVNGMPGLVILPDTFTMPDSINFIAKGQDENPNNLFYQNPNDFNYIQWEKMEKAGAVFLPATGWRDVKDTQDVGSFVIYWSATNNDVTTACAYGAMGQMQFGVFRSMKNIGRPVRLVRDI